MGSLAELFDRNPKELTLEDRKKIIQALAEGRNKWWSEQNRARTEGRKARLSSNSTPEKMRGMELPDELKDLKIDI